LAASSDFFLTDIDLWVGFLSGFLIIIDRPVNKSPRFTFKASVFFYTLGFGSVISSSYTASSYTYSSGIISYIPSSGISTTSSF
jgi:hypothetical protein